ncbi:hypothetical protein QZH41_005384 [Actinostola sp. cb2023]|nr:hypothetical protein QZH41_005384 [Actinostola sp. cb2023]
MPPRRRRKKTKVQIQQLLHRSYYNPKKAEGYAGYDQLSRQVQKHGIRRRQVKEWLEKQPGYTLHKPVQRRFRRSRVIVDGMDEQWQSDLVDVQRMSGDNQGYKHWLTCVDVLSRYAWIRPIKNKTAPQIIQAYQSIFKEGRQPTSTDERTRLFYSDYTKDGTGNANADTAQKSREVHFTIQPAVDVFQSGRYLVPGVSIVIQIDFNDPQFVLMAAAGCTARFKITRAVFRVRHVKVQAEAHLEVEDKQYKQQQTVVYPIRTSKPIRRTIEAGKSFVSFTDLFQQSVPDYLTIGFVKSTAFNGAYNENPYNFKLFGLKDFRMVVNGVERPKSRFEFKSHDAVEGYEMMFSSTGNMHRGFSNGIKRKDYAHGNALLCINLTPDGKDAKNYTYKKNDGTLDLFLNFNPPLVHNVTVLFLPEFENEILVDPTRWC